MENRIRTDIDPADRFPFAIGEHFSEYIFREDRAPYFRMIFCVEGCLSFVTETDRKRLNSPAILFIRPDYRCSIRAAAPSKSFHMTFGQHILDQCDMYLWGNRPLHSFIRRLWFGADNILHTSDRQTQLLQNLLHLLVCETGGRKPGFEIITIQTLLQMFIHLYREHGDVSPELRTGIRQIDDIVAYISDNISEEFTLDDLAARYSVSPGYLSKRFREMTGIPLFEYINCERVKKACSLLKSSNHSVIDIAFSVGYNNISYFNRYFRKIMKMTPKEFRNYIQK